MTITPEYFLSYFSDNWKQFYGKSRNIFEFSQWAKFVLHSKFLISLKNEHLSSVMFSLQKPQISRTHNFLRWIPNSHVLIFSKIQISASSRNKQKIIVEVIINWADEWVDTQFSSSILALSDTTWGMFEWFTWMIDFSISPKYSRVKQQLSCRLIKLPKIEK
jgi:hypothetical protein